MKPSDKALVFLATHSPVIWNISSVGMPGEKDRRDCKNMDNQIWWYEREFMLAECNPPKQNNLAILMLRALAKWADDSIERRLVRLVYCQGGCLVTAGNLFENGAFKIQTEYEAALAAVELAAEME